MDPPVYGNGTDACPGIGLDRGGSSRLSARYDSGAANPHVALVLVHTDSLHAGARAQQLPDLLRTESDGSDRGGIPQLASGSAAAERLSHPGRAGGQLHCVPDWSSAIPAGETIVPRRALRLAFFAGFPDKRSQTARHPHFQIPLYAEPGQHSSQKCKFPTSASASNGATDLFYLSATQSSFLQKGCGSTRFQNTPDLPCDSQKIVVVRQSGRAKNAIGTCVGNRDAHTVSAKQSHIACD